MTRGTMYLILPNRRILQSCEFNGDMYGSPKDSEQSQKYGHYKEVIERLKRVKNDTDFIKEIREFDEEHFYYQKEGFLQFYETIEYKLKEITNKQREIDMKKETYFEKFFSDYLYFKNVSGETIMFRDENGKRIPLEDKEIITFHFGKFIEKV